MAFTAGTAACGGILPHLWILPSIWFIGMLFSHLVFDRCALIELVCRLKKLHQIAVAKVAKYQRWSGQTPKSKYRTYYHLAVETDVSPVSEPAKITNYEADTYPAVTGPV